MKWVLFFIIVTMSNSTQLARYKKLISYIEQHFKEDITTDQIEEISFYSYRNINRIFEALHNETIGKYIKRLRLEKAAQYLIYSNRKVTDIAYEVGFEDRSAFSKAFKNKFHLSPAAFRLSNEKVLDRLQKELHPFQDETRTPLSYEIDYLPEFEFAFLEYRGDYSDMNGINAVWDELITYASQHNLLSEETIFMTEILDDTEISDTLHFRYHFAILLKDSLSFPLNGLFRKKTHSRQKYAKFIHKGSDSSSIDFYKKIYAFWMLDVDLELADLPTLEFYPNYDEHLPEEELLTEIYIPVK